jgi:hypothetical protein
VFYHGKNIYIKKKLDNYVIIFFKEPRKKNSIKLVNFII